MFGGRRDAALILVLMRCWEQHAEAIALEVGDYNKTTGTMTVRAGKRNKRRRYASPTSWQPGTHPRTGAGASDESMMQKHWWSSSQML